MKNSLIRGVSFIAVSAWIFGASNSFAAHQKPVNSQEKWAEIGLSAKVKLKLVNSMKKQIALHKKMSVEQIRDQLTQSVLEKRERALADGVLTTQVAQALDSALLAIDRIHDKETFIYEEKVQLQTFSESRNFLFGETRAVLRSRVPPILLLIAIPLDIVTWPLAFVLSLITGF